MCLLLENQCSKSRSTRCLSPGANALAWLVVAIGRSLLVIIWHLLADPDARYTDLGSDHYQTRVSPERLRRNHVRQLESLGYTVYLERAI